jgi:AmiR/NasT family two-component response regulator
VELLSDLDGTLNRAEVHQAQGMVMVLLDVGLTEALLLLRARAFASGRPLAELARDVVSGVVDPRSWGDD